MTTMRLERTVEGDLMFSGEVSATDFARLRLDKFDLALLADCEGEGRSAADWLLALETIFRRIREQGIAGVRRRTVMKAANDSEDAALLDAAIDAARGAGKGASHAPAADLPE